MLCRYRATRDLAVGVSQPIEQFDADPGTERRHVVALASASNTVGNRGALRPRKRVTKFARRVST